MSIHQDLVSSCDTAGLPHDHKSLCNSLSNLPTESKTRLTMRLCRMDRSLRLPQDPGLPYSAQQSLGHMQEWVPPWWGWIQNVITHHRNHNRGCWSGVRTTATTGMLTLVHTTLWCASTTTRINCVCFRVHFCVLATSRNHLGSTFLSSYYFFT